MTIPSCCKSRVWM